LEQARRLGHGAVVAEEDSLRSAIWTASAPIARFDVGVCRRAPAGNGEDPLEERVGYTVHYPVRSLVRRLAAFIAAHLGILLLVYGLVLATIGGFQLDHAIHGAATGLNSERQGGVFASFDVVDAHGPPLTGLTNDEANNYYPLALDDDRGAFIYLPLIGHLVGTHDLDVLLKWFFISFFVPLLFVYPLLLYRLTDSIVAAVAAPWVLLGHTPFLRISGLFWIPAWANLLLLPLLLLIAKHWKPKPSRLWSLVALAVVASFASSMRANAGLGFAIGAVMLVLIRMPRWRLRLVSAGLLVLAYLSVSSFAMHAVQLQRDEVVGRDFTSPYPNGHPFWHNGYIGLGYLKNPYGFRPTDAAALAAAHRQDPGATFPTKRYERALRTVYLDTLRRHPGFVLRGWATKAGVVLGLAAHWFSGAVVLLPLLLLFGKQRGARRFQFGLILGAGLVGAATGIFTVPTTIPEIQSGWYGFLLLLWLLSIGWLASPAEAWIKLQARRLSDPRSARPADRTLPWSTPWALKIRVLLAAKKAGRLIGRARGLLAEIGRQVRSAARWRHVRRGAVAAAVVSVVLLANISGKSTDASAAYWGNETQLVDRTAISGTTVEDWTFGGGVPEGWRETARSVKVSHGDLVVVRTRSSSYGRQLSSPPRTLGPGSYVVAVDGRVIEGGLQLGVVDVRAGRTIAYKFYWSGQSFSSRQRMALSFDLANETEVGLILSNFSVAEHRSLWALRSLALTRQPSGCRLNSPFAWFTPASSESAP
jgi:hypothetical protein